MLADPALEKPSKVPDKHDKKVRRAHPLEDSCRSNMNNVRNVGVLKTKVMRLLRNTREIHQKDSDTFAKATKQPGEWCVIVQAGHDGLSNISKGIWEKFKARFLTLVAEQQEDLDQNPILIEDFWYHGGRIVIEPADQESRDRIIALVKDKVVVNGESFLP